MGLFERTKHYDRTRILFEATQARSKKRWKKTIALYRRILAVERHAPQIHAKVASLLAATGQHFDAWVSFQIVARACLRGGRGGDSLAVYRDAAGHLPGEIHVWQSIARPQVKRGRRRAALEALIERTRLFDRVPPRPCAVQRHRPPPPATA